MNFPGSGPSVAACLVASASYPDGSAGAPAGTIQRAALLNGYAARPPWQVAGVDYAVGIPTANASVLTDWRVKSGTGITVNNPGTTAKNLRIDGTSNLVLDSIDFTLGNGAYLFLVGVDNLTVSNCKFGGTNYATSVGAGVITLDNTCTSITVTNCEIDGGGAGAGACLLYFRGTGAITFKYNWCKNYPQQVIETVDNGATALDYRYNFIEGGAQQTGSHHNVLQWGAGTGTNLNCCYNTIVQDVAAAGGGAENWQFYFNTSGTFTAPVACSNNTMIAKSPGSCSYMIHGGAVTGTPTANQNYVDISGATGGITTIFYPASMSGWTTTGNINMSTGGAQS